MISHPLDTVPRRPLTCIWEITGACNLQCIHCGNHSEGSGRGELSFHQMVRVLDSLKALGCQMIDITGGEPLLHPRWDFLAREITDRGIKASLITNGTLLDTTVLDRAVQAGVQLIAVSLDGLREVHNRIRLGDCSQSSSWDRAVDAVCLAIERVPTTVITQVNLYNLHQLRAMRGMLREMGVDHWQLQLAIPTGNLLTWQKPFVLAPHQVETLAAFIVDAVQDGQPPFIDTSDTIGYYTAKEPFLRKRRSGQGVWLGCQAGIRTVSIKADGSVRGCSLLPAEFDAGNLHQEPFEDIWKDKERFAASTCFDPRKLTGKCYRCRFGALCRAGCTTMAYWTTGTIYENPYCLSRGRNP